MKKTVEIAMKHKGKKYDKSVIEMAMMMRRKR